ncbi:hypothetical protein ACE1CI_32645 [Aerosakkonemataceae cyanobacterium BLCC-F50]|uniref:LAGLIDADG homing endonuclease n=1 Tax=Floridaenema flaviceps BLCC-F50 TaxID=3153642 RepID=A0ABV4Y316_9CYAN
MVAYNTIWFPNGNGLGKFKLEALKKAIAKEGRFSVAIDQIILSNFTK